MRPILSSEGASEVESKSGQQKAEFQMGDHVRLKADGADGPVWRVVARSYAKGTYDLMACDPRSPIQFHNRVEPELIEKIEQS